MDNNKSYRIHTSVGISNKLINVNLQQDMDFLEVLSIKLSQSNFYKLHSLHFSIYMYYKASCNYSNPTKKCKNTKGF